MKKQEKPIEFYAKSSEVVDGKTIYHHKNGSFFSIFNREGKRKFRYYVKTNCTNCNKEYFSDRNNFKNYKRSFCSNECKKIGNSGPNNANWIGRRKKKTSGHILAYAPNHPNAYKNFVPEHRLIMEDNIGRYLEKDEFIHHIDYDPGNNDIENLIIVSTWQHQASHESFKTCLPDLIKRNQLIFNRKEFRYEVT